MKFFATFPLVMCILFLALSAAAVDQERLGNAKASGARMPIYHNGELKFLVFGESMTMAGNNVLITNPIIDLLRDGVDVDAISYQSEQENLYAFDAAPEEVFSYWKKHPHSEGVVTSPAGEVNRTTKAASGEGKVSFRSPAMDIQGIGFVADSTSSTLSVTENVQIVLRPDFAEIDFQAPKSLPETPGLVYVWANRLDIDFDKGLITLNGDVRIDDKSGRVTCDRLILMLDQEKSSRTSQSVTPGLAGASGIQQVECIGNVVVRAKDENGEWPDEPQEAYADRIYYLIKSGKLVLSGQSPRLVQGSDQLSGKRIEIQQQTGKIIIDGSGHISTRSGRIDQQEPTEVFAEKMVWLPEENKAELAGNVTIEDQDLKIACQKILFHLTSENNQPAPREENRILTGSSSISGGALLAGGDKQLHYAECFDSVSIQRRGSTIRDERAAADYARYNPGEGVIVLGGVRPELSRGSDRLSAETITFYPEKNTVHADGDCIILLTRQQKDATPALPTRVRADHADFDYQANRGTFSGKVKITDPQLDVECDTMTIVLSENTPNNPVQDNNLTTMPQYTARELTEIICVGDVLLERKKELGEVEKASAGKAIYRVKEGKILLSDGNPAIIRGRDSISGKEMIILLEEEKLLVDQNSKIVLESLRGGAFAKANPARTIVKSDYTELDFGNNVLSFSGRVKVADPQLDLDSDQLKIYLLDTNPSEAKSTASTATDPFAGNRQLHKIICSGHVQARDPRASMQCDELVLHFLPDASGKESEFSSGGTMLSLIDCNGNVHFSAIQEGTPGKKSGELFANQGTIHLQDNRAIFTGNVKMLDESSNQLTSEELEFFATETGITPDLPPLDPMDENFDPWAETVMPETYRIGLGANRELEKIVARRSVEFFRTADSGELEKAIGEEAVYDPGSQEVRLLGSMDNPARLQRGGTIQLGEDIRYNLANGRFIVLKPVLQKVGNL